MKRIVGIVLGLILLLQGAVAWAGSESQESTGAKIGYGTGAVVGSAVYFPFKASFCILGGLGSGFALLFSGSQAANKVASTSCRGTWAITPDIVKGEETVHFVGEVPASSPASESQARQ